MNSVRTGVALFSDIHTVSVSSMDVNVLLFEERPGEMVGNNGCGHLLYLKDLLLLAGISNLSKGMPAVLNRLFGSNNADYMPDLHYVKLEGCQDTAKRPWVFVEGAIAILVAKQKQGEALKAMPVIGELLQKLNLLEAKEQEDGDGDVESGGDSDDDGSDSGGGDGPTPADLGNSSPSIAKKLARWFVSLKYKAGALQEIIAVLDGRMQWRALEMLIGVRRSKRTSAAELERRIAAAHVIGATKPQKTKGRNAQDALRTRGEQAYELMEALADSATLVARKKALDDWKRREAQQRAAIYEEEVIVECDNEGLSEMEDLPKANRAAVGKRVNKRLRAWRASCQEQKKLAAHESRRQQVEALLQERIERLQAAGADASMADARWQASRDPFGAASLGTVEVRELFERPDESTRALQREMFRRRRDELVDLANTLTPKEQRQGVERSLRAEHALHAALAALRLNLGAGISPRMIQGLVNEVRASLAQ